MSAAETEKARVPPPPAPVPVADVTGPVMGRRAIVASRDDDSDELVYKGVRGDDADPYLRVASEMFTDDLTRRLFVRVASESQWDEWVARDDADKPPSCPRTIAVPAFLVFTDQV